MVKHNSWVNYVYNRIIPENVAKPWVESTQFFKSLHLLNYVV